MKGKGVLVGAVALVFSAAAFATNWQLRSIWPAPAANVRGYSYGSHYVLTDGNPPRVWPFDFRNFGPPIALGVPPGAWGLEVGPAGFVVTNYNNSYIYHVNTAGSIVSSFRSPRDHPAEVAKVGYGSYMVVAYPEENVALRMTTTGSVITTYPGPGTHLTAWHSSNGLLAADDQTHKVYTFKGTISVPAVAGITPVIWGSPYSAFVLTDMSTNTVQYWTYGGVQPVAPASFGRVKALFN